MTDEGREWKRDEKALDGAGNRGSSAARSGKWLSMTVSTDQERGHTSGGETKGLLDADVGEESFLWIGMEGRKFSDGEHRRLLRPRELSD